MISQACNYYGSYQKGYHAAMAWYSRGCVLSLTDDDRETVSELMLFDEDNTLLSQGLMQGLDEELDSFLKDLLAE